ncbi:Cupredoxin [Marinomonas sp. 2405UD68-3]|uniref:Cupredoxin n=1 Tax=Marinomonas sp. 2405UD68-3 TaxID=3391835 RepID=UPI0039C928CA
MLSVKAKAFILMVTGSLCASLSLASTLSVTVSNEDGQPIKNTVVELYNPDYLIDSASYDGPKAFEVAQRMRQFQPFVLAVPVGSSITFPNYDKTRHHVYSFSPIKTFELKLFSGQAHDPVIFNEAGVVALGCNIHDAMQSHIYVTDSRYFMVTDENGQVQFSSLPETSFNVKVWHPLQGEAVEPQMVATSSNDVSLNVNLSIIEEFEEDEFEDEYAY